MGQKHGCLSRGQAFEVLRRLQFEASFTSDNGQTPCGFDSSRPRSVNPPRFFGRVGTSFCTTQPNG